MKKILNWETEHRKIGLKKLKYSCVTAETNKAETQPRPPEKAKLSTVYAQLFSRVEDI